MILCLIACLWMNDDVYVEVNKIRHEQFVKSSHSRPEHCIEERWLMHSMVI
jgi:hypothetical protein